MAEVSKLYPPPQVSTPRRAPWDHVEELCNKLDQLIAMTGGVVPYPPGVPSPPGMPYPPGVPAPPVESLGWEPIINKLEEVRLEIAELKVAVSTTWEAKPPVELFSEPINSAGTISSAMVSWKKGKRLFLFVDSSLNQAAQIQPVGNIKNSVLGSVNINAPLNCAANSMLSVGMAWDDWINYIGATITTIVAPTAGVITVWAVIQE